MQAYLGELATLKTLADSHEVPIVYLLVATQDASGKVRDDVARRHALVRDFCLEHDLVCVDTLASVANWSAENRSVRFPHDSHWNPAGHDLAAWMLAENASFPLQDLASGSRNAP